MLPVLLSLIFVIPLYISDVLPNILMAVRGHR